MNAPQDPLSRAEEQALSEPFLIEDEATVRLAARLADERGTSMAEIVALALESYMDRHSASSPAPDWLRKFWREHPLPLPTGLKADKRFFDALSGDL
jgi:antitoxin VapB